MAHYSSRRPIPNCSQPGGRIAERLQHDGLSGQRPAEGTDRRAGFPSLSGSRRARPGGLGLPDLAGARARSAGFTVPAGCCGLSGGRGGSRAGPSAGGLLAASGEAGAREGLPGRPGGLLRASGRPAGGLRIGREAGRDRPAIRRAAGAAAARCGSGRDLAGGRARQSTQQATPRREVSAARAGSGGRERGPSGPRPGSGARPDHRAGAAACCAACCGLRRAAPGGRAAREKKSPGTAAGA